MDPQRKLAEECDATEVSQWYSAGTIIIHYILNGSFIKNAMIIFLFVFKRSALFLPSSH